MSNAVLCRQSCPHLSITEEEQDRLVRESGSSVRDPHICKKYGAHLLHHSWHPDIVACPMCVANKDYEPLGNSGVISAIVAEANRIHTESIHRGPIE